MTDQDRDPHPDSPPAGPDAHPDSGPEASKREDDRTDTDQIVQSRADAVSHGEGGPEPDPMLRSGNYSGVSGDGGEVKNQGLTQQ